MEQAISKCKSLDQVRSYVSTQSAQIKLDRKKGSGIHGQGGKEKRSRGATLLSRKRTDEGKRKGSYPVEVHAEQKEPASAKNLRELVRGADTTAVAKAIRDGEVTIRSDPDALPLHAAVVKVSSASYSRGRGILIWPRFCFGKMPR